MLADDSASDLVSIVVPAFNAAPWIGAAVSSALDQRGVRIEVVVADNGSVDGTVHAARRAGPVTIVEVAKRGPSAARNAALARCRGAFVQFLDADDLLAPDKVARQRDLLRSSGGDVAWGSFTRFRDGVDEAFGVAPRTPQLGDDVTADLIRTDGFLHLGAALFRASALQSVRFDESVRVVEDVRFELAVALSGARFVRDAGPAGYAMREHESASRASRVSEEEFAEACVTNARMVVSEWRARGESLSPARTKAVAEPLLYAAEVLAKTSPARTRALLRELGALDPNYARRLRRPQREVAALIGSANALVLVASVRRVRDTLLRR